MSQRSTPEHKQEGINLPALCWAGDPLASAATKGNHPKVSQRGAGRGGGTATGGVRRCGEVARARAHRCGGSEERFEHPGRGRRVPPQQRALAEGVHHLARDCDVGEEHELLDHLVRLAHLYEIQIRRKRNDMTRYDKIRRRSAISAQETMKHTGCTPCSLRGHT